MAASSRFHLLYSILVFCWFTSLVFTGCMEQMELPVRSPDVQDDSGSSESGGNWTILVYLNGDSDLESQALSDLNEMEASFSLAGMEVLVLVDRSRGYDTSLGDWTGTRLYRIRKDRGGLNYDLVSERLACPPLDLGDHGDYDELNLGIPEILSTFISYGKTEYPSDKTMLIIWGHGTGWRGGPPHHTSLTGPRFSGYRAFSFDDTDCDFLYTSELGEALEKEPVDMIVFDTCSSALLEVVWEIKGGTKFFAGSEDLVPIQGLDYQDFFTRLAAGNGTPESAGEALLESFADSYGEQSGAVFSIIEMAKVENVMDSLEDFAATRMIAALDTDDPELSFMELKERFTENVEDFFSAPGDLNLDLGDLGLIMDGEESPLVKAVDDAVIGFFSSGLGNIRARGLAVHLTPLGESGEILPHDPAYLRNGYTEYPLEFTAESSWCPDIEGRTGLLYHLFYE